MEDILSAFPFGRFFLGNFRFTRRAAQVLSPCLREFENHVVVSAGVADTRNGFIPRCKVAIGIPRTSKKDALTLGLPLDYVAILALGTLNADADWFCVLARRIV